MAPYSSILAWRTPWMEEAGGLQSMGSQRVRQDRSSKHSTAACVTQDSLSWPAGVPAAPLQEHRSLLFTPGEKCQFSGGAWSQCPAAVSLSRPFLFKAEVAFG